MDIYNKTAIVIGSGSDINGRALGKKIDSGHWDIVIRCNKPYGSPVDVGSRLDIIATRYRSWVARFFGDVHPSAVVAFNEAYNITHAEYQSIMQEVGWTAVSCGVLACAWALNRGARDVYVLGFGHAGSWHHNRKIYPDGVRDTNPHYHWDREAQWVRNNCSII